MWECEWWRLYKTKPLVKHHLRDMFPYKLPLREEGLLQRIKDGNLFRYVQCDTEMPEHLREKFANFPPIFKNTDVSRNDIGPLMKEYAEKKQPSFSTSPNVDIMFPSKEWYFDHSAIFILFGFGTGLDKNIPLCGIYSNEMLQQVCAVSSEC